ncbi:truncated exodeoxyribonuclease VII large subunit [Helicobacter cinaedi CCUG 18818 = ATCC BAA-847]|uniref:Truncated exodeoxyribonuclease VII large subunit n=1 Tax=Helicobacter cinaedi CCUG 18818 = ATCC BAA-847 TaxID=537971 RepID=A0AAI8MM88_9HELI|nr:exodeoxyribonuclease VII large subunit [Helicobacter cinaedi]BAM32110.1 truncated exodeoxyribonuclease VII large subunit [Helicobacter cinaedi CCUG 18818 = ATCC BAA-847]
MRCVIFKGNASKLRFQMQEGLNLIVRGSVSAYIPRGEYQINCLEVLPDGIGELSLTYQQLKTSLQARGYFDNKKPIPAFPKRVAVLTSITGAVIEDIKKSRTKAVESCEVFCA